MNFQPIETRYAGCRFRSRLEARYAVLFDKLGIRWEYEVQGFLVGEDDEKRPYLPDFWLPADRLWVEVKGTEESLDVELIRDAVIPHGGLPADPTGALLADTSRAGARMLILGPLGRGVVALSDKATGEAAGYGGPTHTVLSFWKGDVLQGAATLAVGGVVIERWDGGIVGNDSRDVLWANRGTEWGGLTREGMWISDTFDQRVADAYRAARSARFEHGESG
ncbi:hypothetical protein ACIBHX_01725 [Nonomuraea sp. NPDC050536]|uniref:hypothetical protein n=1 Tax=Nonomuraea sp. NPDC050536 TaxID=3364366 RepID=UPI0037C4F35D